MMLGRISGSVTTKDFSFKAEAKIKKLQYIAVKDFEGRWILGYIDSITNYANSTLAKAKVIGFRDARNFLKPLSVPFEPSTPVYSADDELIKLTLGLKDDGLYIGILEGYDIPVTIPARHLITKHVAILAKSGAGKSVTYDTPIIFENGEIHPIGAIVEKAIGNSSTLIQNGDTVYTCEKSGKKVLTLDCETCRIGKSDIGAYIRHSAPEKLLKIETASGREVMITPEHNVFTLKDFIIKSPASKLRCGDSILVSSSLPIRNSVKNGTLSIDILEKVSLDEINVLVKSVSKYLPEKMIAQPRRYLKPNQKMVRLSKVRNLCGSESEWEMVKSKIDKVCIAPGKEISRFLIIDKDLVHFLAYIIAEGHIQTRRTLFSTADKKMGRDFIRICERKFNIKPKRMSNNANFYIDSRLLTEVMLIFGIGKEKSSSKKIENSILTLPDNLLIAFLRNLFDCEGSIYRKYKRKSFVIEFTSASKNMIYNIQLLLQRYGISCRVTKTVKYASNTEKKTKRLYYRLSICDSRNIVRFIKHVGFNLSEKRKMSALATKIKIKGNTNVDLFPVNGSLKELLEDLEISQSELARLSGLSQRVVNLYCLERETPSRDALSAIVGAAGMKSGKFSDISSRFDRLVNSDFLVDRIKKIETIDNSGRNRTHEYVYDISVPGNENFIGGFGGIVLHNSYAAGVLLEELAEKKIPVVVIDPHGEYRTMVEENRKENEVAQMKRFGIQPKSYKDKVHIFDAGAQNPVKLDSKLSVEDIFEMLPAKISSGQQAILYSAMKNLMGKEYTLRDVIEEVNSIDSNAKRNLVSLLEFLEATKLFSANPTKPDELVKEGRMTIVDLKEASPEVQQLIVYKLAKELFNARKYGKIPEFFFVFEEAHNFCPERGLGEVASSKMLRVIASEGRKFGVGLCIISQRPAKVDKNVLSQCSTQIILKVTNPNDIRAIMDSVEGMELGTREEIKDLPVGIGMIVGVTEQPLIVDIRIRRSQHGGEAVVKQLEPGEKGEAGEVAPVYESKIPLYAPRFFEEDILRVFKSVDDLRFLNYPIWKAEGVHKGQDVELLVDGITGEIVFERGENVESSRGINSVMELQQPQRNILVYLAKNGSGTVDKISGGAKMLLSEAQSALKHLAEKKLVRQEGDEYSLSSSVSLPCDSSHFKISRKIIERDREGETLDFTVTRDFVKKVADIWDINILEVKPVYYPYWVITHKRRKYMVNAITNRLEIDKAKALKGTI
jgi:DNA helicase HerA-like ATPase/transcriptional regulator with XRE-family HTH domain